jgi:hypothetical protein
VLKVVEDAFLFIFYTSFDGAFVKIDALAKYLVVEFDLLLVSVVSELQVDTG